MYHYYCLGEDILQKPEIPPYYSEMFFDTIKKVIFDTPSGQEVLSGSAAAFIWLELPRRRLPHKKSYYFPHHYQLYDPLVIIICICTK